MNNTVSVTYSKLSLPLPDEGIAQIVDKFILENSPSLYDDFLSNHGNPAELTKEIGDVFKIRAAFSVNGLAFVDEWSVTLFQTFDILSADQCRKLLYQLFFCFVENATFEQLCEKFKLSSADLLNEASAPLVLDWLTLWMVHNYPSTALFLFGKIRVRIFLSTCVFHLSRLICYLPVFMLWQIGLSLHQLKTRRLTLELASGQNIRRALACPFPFTRKMAHLFINSPRDMTFDTAIWYAIVRGWGGNKWLTEQLKTYFSHQQKQPDFIHLLVLFFKKTDPKLSTNEMKYLLGYLQHRWDESEHFTLKGWTLASLQRKAMQWYQTISQQQLQNITSPNLALSWKGADYKTFSLEDARSSYEIIQLNSIKKLQEEGRRMMHCVGSYAARCQLDKCSIWSLRQTTGDRHRSLVTIEITKDHRIVQARKMFNASPEPFERQLIQQWAYREGLNWV